MQSKDFIHYLKTLFNHNPRGIIINLFLMIFLGLLEGIGIFMIIPLLNIAGIIELGAVSDTVFISYFSGIFGTLEMPARLIAVLVIYSGIIILHSLLSRYQSILNAYIQQSFYSELSMRLHRAISYTRWSFVFERKQSDISHSILSETSRVSGGSMFIMRMLTTVIIVLMHLVIAFALSVPLTLLVLFCGIILFLVLKPLLRQSKKAGEEITANMRGLYMQIWDNLGSLKESKTHCAEDRHHESFSKTIKKIENTMIDFVKIQSRTDVFFKIGAALSISIFFYFAIFVYESSPGLLLLLLFIFSRLWPRFTSFQSGLQQLYMMMPAFRNVKELESSCLKEKENIKRTPSEKLVLQNSIEFKEVYFKYLKEADNYTIEDASFIIPALSTVAVTGASGAGKSTLVDLMLGLLTPSAGEIIIDGEPLGEDNLFAWRRSIGYMPQEPFLFNTSVRQNLLWVAPGATENELMNALELAAARDFVLSLPQGLDTVIGDRGIKISGGERQRIVLARTLLKNPSVLVLDEATNELDAENEALILQAIAGLQDKLTVIILSHRQSALKYAHKIITVDAGRITGENYA